MQMPIDAARERKRHLNERFLQAFKTGPLAGLLDILKLDRTLTLCLRGGLSAEYVNVYFKGHSLLKISQQGDTYKATFDFNHARYTRDWDRRLERLQALGYALNNGAPLKLPRLEKNEGQDRLRVVHPRNEISCDASVGSGKRDFWNDSILILKGLVDDFFSPKLTEDVFKTGAQLPQSPRAKQPLIEKQHQQRIMTENSSLDSGYFVFDMEYDQARSNIEEAKSGRFDMLALRKMEEGLYNLVFIELKSTKSACTGKCGIQKHYADLSKYIQDPNFLAVRKADAIEICRQLSELLFDETPVVQIGDQVELLFVFTATARGFSAEIASPHERLSLADADFRLNYPVA